MVKGSGFPAVCGVTGVAIRAKTSLMRVVGAMAGITILWRSLEISRISRIDMALNTDHFLVLPRQLELKQVVIEPFAKSIYPIVAIQAGCAV
jgi:hypothetical protein